MKLIITIQVNNIFELSYFDSPIIIVKIGHWSNENEDQLS
jgi:hypothetical protein